jgi:hypothetical protein
MSDVAFQPYGAGYIARRKIGGRTQFAACLGGSWVGGASPRVFESVAAARRALSCAARNAGGAVAAAHAAAIFSLRAERAAAWEAKKASQAAAALAAAVTPTSAPAPAATPVNWGVADAVVQRTRALHLALHGVSAPAPGARGPRPLFPASASGARNLSKATSVADATRVASANLFAIAKSTGQGLRPFPSDAELAAFAAAIPLAFG